MKLCKVFFLAISIAVVAAGAAHAQTNSAGDSIATGNPDSRPEATPDAHPGAHFNLPDLNATNTGSGSQANLVADISDPAPSAAPVDQPLSLRASTSTTDTASQSTTTPVGLTSDSDFHLAVTGYLWLPGVHGIVGALDRTVNVSASPADLLSNFRFGLMGVIEPSYKRFIMPIDVMWIRLEDDKAIPFPDLEVNTAKIKGTEFILTPKIGYRIIDQEKIKVDALAGFRFWYFGENLSFSPSNGLNFSRSQEWVDPVVGGRITVPLSPKIVAIIAGDVGGWDTGSQLDYQAVGILGYRIKPAMTLQVGYRYLDVDYRSAGTIIDMATSGVLFGVTMNLK